MKRKNTIWPILGAFVLGIICIILFIKLQQDQKAQYNETLNQHDTELKNEIIALREKINNQPVPSAAPIIPVDMRRVVYATQAIKAGTKIDPNMVKAQDTPKTVLIEAYTEGDIVTNIVGRYALRDIEVGDPISQRNVGQQKAHLSERLSPGMRALSLAVFNSDAAHDGRFTVDGDFVDLYYTRPSSESGGVATDLVLQLVKVLYIPNLPPESHGDQVSGVNPAGPAQVTFEVTPEEAQQLILLDSVSGTHFAMVLRARKDTDQVRIASLDSAEVLDDLRKLQAKANRSIVRVNELGAALAEKEKAQSGTPDVTPKSSPTP